MKLWSGRFNKESSKLLDQYNNSITFDYILYEYDILGSIAHIKMLNKINIITEKEMEKIINGLNEIKYEIENDIFEFTIEDEDIHMSIEKALIKKIGNVGKKLHTARSRNDQIALDMKLYTKDIIIETKKSIKKLLQTLIYLSEQNIDVYMPGYTHLQGAQIITLGFYFQCYFQKFKRDFERFEEIEKRVDIMPLGVGALAGVNYETDRFYIARELSFSKITENALDTVSDRDYILEYLNASSIMFLHLSRFCEEIIIYASQEYNFFIIDDAYSTGSSIMPQKKNPDVAELIRGKSGEVISSLFGLFTTMKGLPLAYNKDMQEDKKYLFRTSKVVLDTLEIFNQMILTIEFNKDIMKRACLKGFLQATDIADYLVKGGLEFREAHRIVGEMVFDLDKKKMIFQDLSINDFKKYSKIFNEDIIELLKIENSVSMKKSYGSTSYESVKKMIINSKEFTELLK
ncbi:MAG: argininosuccinate lyase [Bacillota bacterium]|nr:argininosuccinate lyase [Bacillota bacterium]